MDKVAATQRKRTSPEKLAFGIRHRFDHEPPVAGIKEKLTTLGIGDKLDKVRVAANRQQKVEFIHTSKATQVRKSNRRVILEFERVGELVWGSQSPSLGAKLIFLRRSKVCGLHPSPFFAVVDFHVRL